MGNKSTINNNQCTQNEWIVLENPKNSKARQHLDRIRTENPHLTLLDCALLAIDDLIQENTKKPTKKNKTEASLSLAEIKEEMRLCVERAIGGDEASINRLDEYVLMIENHPEEMTRRSDYYLLAQQTTDKIRKILTESHSNIKLTKRLHTRRVVEAAILPSTCPLEKWVPSRFNSDFSTNSLHDAELVGVWGALTDHFGQDNPHKTQWYDNLTKKVMRMSNIHPDYLKLPKEYSTVVKKKFNISPSATLL
jgi:hypothetical protein